MSELSEILDTIKDEALQEAVAEFKSMLGGVEADGLEILGDTAKQASGWLVLKAEGKLTANEVSALLQAQKQIAQIFANAQVITQRSRVQGLACRLLDIVIRSVAVAI